MNSKLSLEEALHILRTETVTHGNDEVRVIDVLYMLSSGLSDKGEKEKALQGKVDNILTLLSSNDVDLDEFQEVVDFIKANKSKLDSLGISNIAGLEAVLDGKANITSENLSSEDVKKWKTALGVGELPSNIATVDELDNVGNTYTKEKIDELLQGGLAEVEHISHRVEEIEQGIEKGLEVKANKSELESKSDKTSLNAKANADATELGEENIGKWKEVLGVGELPDNIATIDKNSETGNAYNKEQIDEKLSESIGTWSENATNNPNGLSYQIIQQRKLEFGNGIVNGNSNTADISNIIRRNITWNTLSHWGVIHLDVKSSRDFSGVIARLPEDAPLPTSLIEVQLDYSKGYTAWIDAGSRNIEGRIPANTRFIFDLMGYFKV